MSVFTGRNQDRKEFKVVGTRGIPGRQSYAIATGLAMFPRDIVVPDMLHAKFLRSPYAHARIKSMDVSKAQALPGVKAIVRWEDPEVKAFPVLNVMRTPTGPMFGDVPVLSDVADYEGREVGVCVAAESEEICDEALKLIKVEWEVLPFILDPNEAVKPDAPILFPDIRPKDNIDQYRDWEDGNVEDGFKAADYVIEYDLNAAWTYDIFPNPNTNVAYWAQDPMSSEGKSLFMDSPMHIQTIGPQFAAMEAMRLPEEKYRCLTMYWGGKYCHFMTYSGEAFTPLLAKRTGRPVRIADTRRDAFMCGNSEAYNHVKIGFTKDGMLTAAHCKTVHNIGARANSPGSWDITIFRTTKCPNIKQEGPLVYTNVVRGTHDDGTPYGDALLAKAFTLIAEKLGMDPTEVALKNCHTPEPSLKQCIENGKKAIGWAEKWHAPGTKKLPNGKMHGLAFKYHDGARSVLTHCCTLAIKTDGKVYMPYQEGWVGTFWCDAAAMVIAEEVGAKLEDVIVHFVPGLTTWLIGTARERGPSGSWAFKEAAIDLKAKLLAVAAADLKVKPEELDTKDSTVYLKADPTKSYPFRQFANRGSTTLAASYVGMPPPYAGPKKLTCFNTFFYEVEVDTETGLVEITNYVAATDAGKVIRPSSYEGQIEGQSIRGLGPTLFEELIFDKATGVRLNSSILEYMPITILELPPIIMPTIETRLEGGAYGATAQSHNGARDAGAISCAVYNAIGKWIDIPITPDKVLKALGKI